MPPPAPAPAAATMQPASSSAAALTAAHVRRVVLIRRIPRNLRNGLAVGPTVSCANIPGSGTSRLPCLSMVRMLPRSQILGPRTAISYTMDQILGWARLWFAAKREDEGEASLRNGAWYPVLSSGVNRAVLEVSGQRVAVPQDLVEVRDKRPDRFTVVYRTHDDPNPARGTRADAGRRYGVCPKCPNRIPIRMGIIPSRAPCHKCKHEGIVAWGGTGGIPRAGGGETTAGGVQRRPVWL